MSRFGLSTSTDSKAVLIVVNSNPTNCLILPSQHAKAEPSADTRSSRVCSQFPLVTATAPTAPHPASHKRVHHPARLHVHKAHRRIVKPLLSISVIALEIAPRSPPHSDKCKDVVQRHRRDDAI